LPTIRPAGPYPIEGIETETWLVRFDKNGLCSSPRTREAFLDRLAATPNSPVLFFSHGWNNDFADAVDLYTRFLTHFEKILKAYPLAAPAPLFVGVTWPSMWLPADSGPQMAGGAPEAGTAETSSVETAVREIADVLPANADLQRYYELTEKQLSQAEARELAGILKPVFQPSDDGSPEADVSEDAIVQALNDLQKLESGTVTSDDDIDKIGTVAGTGGIAEPAAAGLSAFLDPRWALRLASLYVMKDRAGRVGATGASALLRDMLQRTSGPIHAIGHSFGGKVMLSAIATQPNGARPVQSLLLLQPAVSHLCFAQTVPGRTGPGGYSTVIDRVVRPILSTYSTNDFPLHTIYHRALLRRSDLGELRVAMAATPAGDPPNAYAALGGYGPRGASERLIGKIPDPGTAIDAAGARIVGLDGSLDQRIASHGGVANQYTAWALRSAMTT
jgi:pimeloyl-ACP methyl ester carboxylesterase